MRFVKLTSKSQPSCPQGMRSSFFNHGLVRLGLKQHVFSVERKMKASFFASNYLSYCPEVCLKISSEFTKRHGSLIKNIWWFHI